METVGSFEAKTHFSALLERVAKGETITITKHGVPVAKLVPANAPAKRSREEVLRDLEEFGKGRSLGGLTFRQLIDEGRRF
ncbi:MAG: type II toxin-antitoxin system prevent-host-death family antitoxin [Acidobacteria bacterium]|jgi:prevent-host-death family protein|nr:type II toxin-antitoxin system prevent-host-death family antitoxin [Acidobacteriota bacterium]